MKLLENGADVNATTNGGTVVNLVLFERELMQSLGQTPLHLAASHGASKETLELLLLHPLINPALENGAGETAYAIARRSGVYYPLFEIFEPCIAEIRDMR